MIYYRTNNSLLFFFFYTIKYNSILLMYFLTGTIQQLKKLDKYSKICSDIIIFQ